ncbi:hypothetical protein ACIQ7D_27785 [Streptomyces sp. NPDC096310]|uniref:hypothetical protein n=1 Tax=Streptomyces sp. NPDC096310 TaxID=3366082 RepID=UPI0038013378
MTLRWLPVARVTVTAIPSRVFYVFPGKRRTQVIGVPSPDRAGRITAVTSALLVGLVILTSVIRFVLTH